VNSPKHPWGEWKAGHQERQCPACGLTQLVTKVKTPEAPRGRMSMQTYWITPEGQVLRGGSGLLCVPRRRG